MCAYLKESALAYKHVTVHAVRQTCANSRVRFAGGGIILGRTHLRTAASPSSLFDDVPHYKALNTQMSRLRGEVEMGAFQREVRWAGPFHKEI